MKGKHSRPTTTLRHRAVRLLMGLLLVMLCTLPARSKGAGDGAGPRGQSYDLSWYTIDGGGEMFSTGGTYELSGTIGQPDANELVMTGGSYALSGGFWPGTVAAWTPGDCDFDGDVDLDDFAGIEDCLLGPGGGLGAGCDCYDADDDGDVDLADFGRFQAAFTGTS